MSKAEFDGGTSQGAPIDVPAGSSHKRNASQGIPAHHSSQSWQAGCKQCSAEEKSNTHPLTYVSKK